MPNTRGNIHIDRALTNFSLKYANGSLIADAVCPRVSVTQESDKYFVYGRRNFRGEDDYRADKSDPNWVHAWTIESTPTYTCEEHSLADLVSDRERANADQPLNPDMDVVNSLTDKIEIGREGRVATLLTTYENFASSGNRIQLSGDDQWNDFDFAENGVPIEERVDNAKEAIRRSIGRDPNTIIIPAAVAKVVKRDPAIREIVKYTDTTLLVNGDLPRTLWNLNVLIPGGIYDSAAEGQAFSAADIWGKHVVLLYAAPNPQSPRTMTACLTFEAQPRQVAKWRENGKKADAVEVSEILVEKLVSEYCAYLIQNAIS